MTAIRYTVRFERRSSIALRVGEDGSVQVRAPIGCPRAQIEAALEKHGRWLCARREDAARAQAARRPVRHRLTSRLGDNIQTFAHFVSAKTKKVQKNPPPSVSGEGRRALNFGFDYSIETA